jgi:hypothetical protein
MWMQTSGLLAHQLAKSTDRCLSNRIKRLHCSDQKAKQAVPLRDVAWPVAPRGTSRQWVGRYRLMAHGNAAVKLAGAAWICGWAPKKALREDGEQNGGAAQMTSPCGLKQVFS